MTVSDAIRDRNGGQASAAVEHAARNAGHTAGKFDLCKRRAAVEQVVTDVLKSGGKLDFRKRAAVVEHIRVGVVVACVAGLAHAQDLAVAAIFFELDFGKLFAAAERIRMDLRDGRRDFDFRDLGAAERIRTDFVDLGRILERDRFHVAAVECVVADLRDIVRDLDLGLCRRGAKDALECVRIDLGVAGAALRELDFFQISVRAAAECARADRFQALGKGA